VRHALPLLSLLLACNRTPSALQTASSATPVSSPAPSAPLAPPTAGAPPDPLQELALPLHPEVQALETSTAHPGYQALLAPISDLIQQRFPGVSTLSLQVVPLRGLARALLLHDPASKARPLLVAFDEQRNLAWFKERPIHDLDPSIARMALCPGPDGDLFLVFHDPPTGIVAARRWDQGGGILADFRLGHAEQLDGLAALYWPERGWLVAHSSAGAVKVQLLEERGRLAWGRDGKVLTPSGALPGPLRLALDTEVSAHVLWPGAGATGRHHLASRIDFEGSPLWRAPVDLGDADDHQPPRIERSGHALIHAELTGKSGPYAVDISAEGRVLIR
jgi:hypothetical protein